MKEYQLHGLRALAQSPKGTVPAFLQAPATQGAWRFHHALEDYGPTPLVRLMAWRRSWAWAASLSRMSLTGLV